MRTEANVRERHIGGLYTPAQRVRRDQSRWTLVQGILAPIQFLICAISAVLVIRYLVTGNGLFAANWSVIIKTTALYAIMYTGALWEHDVYGQYLFAPAFFWEDAVSMVVVALHTAYVVALTFDMGTPAGRLFIALAGYVAYAINATQFILKLRAARLQEARNSSALGASAS
jgi:3-vinyl bacteriochlorophyllide hydratase